MERALTATMLPGHDPCTKICIYVCGRYARQQHKRTLRFKSLKNYRAPGLSELRDDIIPEGISRLTTVWGHDQ
jgi:hypothetical protein